MQGDYLLVGRNGVDFEDIELFLKIDNINFKHIGIDKYMKEVSISHIIVDNLSKEFSKYISEVIELKTSFYGIFTNIIKK